MNDLASRPHLGTGVLTPLTPASYSSAPKAASVLFSALLIPRMAASSVAALTGKTPSDAQAIAAQNITAWTDTLKQRQKDASSAFKALSDSAQIEFRNVYFDREVSSSQDPPAAAVAMPGVTSHILSLVYLCKAVSMLSESTTLAQRLVQHGALQAIVCAGEHARRMDDAYAETANASAEALRAAWGTSTGSSDIDATAQGVWHRNHPLAPGSVPALTQSAQQRAAAPSRWRFFAHSHTKICRHVAKTLANLSFRLPMASSTDFAPSLELLADFAFAQDLKLVAQARRAEANVTSRTSSDVQRARLPRYGSMIFPLTDDYEAVPGAASLRNDVDLVFIHGLQGSALKTWKCPCLRVHDHIESAVQSADVTLHEGGQRLPVWPAAWLLPDLRAAGIKPRLLSLEYDAQLNNTAGPRPTAPLTDVAARAAAQLAAARVGRHEDGSQRPVVYIVHSMGGLLVKTMMTDINDLLCDDDGSGINQVADSAVGALMYGVPHRGSPLGKLIGPASLPLIRDLLSVTDPVSRLGENDPSLLQLHDRFMAYLQRRQELAAQGGVSVPPLQVLSILEGQATDIHTPGVPLLFVVPEWSGAMHHGRQVTVESDHINLCKPMSGNDPIYQECRQFVTDIMQDTPIAKHS
jgi:hypothetical protein